MLTPAEVRTAPRTARWSAVLLRVSLRAVPKVPLVLGALAGLLSAAIPALLHMVLGLPDAAMLSRAAAVTVALGVGFALDDPAARTTVVVPVTRLVQRAVRAVPVFAAGLACWAMSAAVARLTVEPQARSLFPWGGLALEAGALGAVSLALAALGLHFTDGEHGSMIAAPGILLLVITAALLPDGAALFLPPGHRSWTAAHEIWAGTLVAALAAATILARSPETTRPNFRRHAR
jgi:hypothetical protein